MLQEIGAETNLLFYLMIGVGVIGLAAKLVNHMTLKRMVRAAANMSKSTHKLVKLVRAKYEHASIIHDSVENADAFVEKYIYEYRGFLFRIHTWRQLEIQAIWFSGIFALLGVAAHFAAHEFCEGVFQYLALGAAEMVLLAVISQISDERYKINAARNYMVEYLDNVCAPRYRKTRQSGKEKIDVIHPENASTARATKAEEPDLPINIEGEPRKAAKGEAVRQALRKTMKAKTIEREKTEPETSRVGMRRADTQDAEMQNAARSRAETAEVMQDAEEPRLREEAIRQILEEFLA